MQPQLNKIHMTDTRYNGWSNRETWLVPLWWEECPIESIEANTKEEAIKQLAEQLENLFDEILEEHRIPTASLISDLLQGAVSCIDWKEIAEHWIEDVEVTLSEENATEEEGA